MSEYGIEAKWSNQPYGAKDIKLQLSQRSDGKVIDTYLLERKSFVEDIEALGYIVIPVADLPEPKLSNHGRVFANGMTWGDNEASATQLRWDAMLLLAAANKIQKRVKDAEREAKITLLINSAFDNTRAVLGRAAATKLHDAGIGPEVFE